jgi:hypothetical protein
VESFKGAPSGKVVCYSVTVNIDPPSLATLTGGYLDVAIPVNPGCNTGQRVVCNPAADVGAAGAGAAYLILAPRVSAADTVRLQCVNASATDPLNPAALDYNFVFLGAKSGA